MKALGYTIMAMIILGIVFGIFDHNFLWMSAAGIVIGIPYIQVMDEVEE